jgi:homospermidine synthase
MTSLKDPYHPINAIPSLDITDARIVMIGHGGIGSCMIPLFKRHLRFRPNHIIVFDMDVSTLPFTSKRTQTQTIDGVTYIHQKVTKENYRHLLSSYLRSGDLLLDLAWYIDTLALLEWCHQHNVMYINASVEVWDVDHVQVDKDPREYTLYARQHEIQQQAKKWSTDAHKPTAILTHGANPGWVSSTTKIALRDWALQLAKEGKLDSSLVKRYVDQRRYGKLAQLLNVQTIHITELDTLRQSKPREIGTFLCTWSPAGFYEEATAPAEMGWGTHETLKDGVYGYSEGPKNQVCLATRGMDTLVQSYVPGHNYVGCVIRHEEAYSLSEYLTTFNSFGAVQYRPSVYYVYQPCPDALASLHEVRSNAYREPTKYVLPKRELIDGNDFLGCFLLSRDYGAWWIGTLQSLEDANKLLPAQGPTVLVVAAGVLGAVYQCFLHPQMGVVHPEALDEQEMMKVVEPYLHPFVSGPVSGWQPFVQSKFGVKTRRTKDWTFDRLQVV